MLKTEACENVPSSLELLGVLGFHHLKFAGRCDHIVEMIGVKNRAYCSVLAEIAKTCMLL